MTVTVFTDPYCQPCQEVKAFLEAHAIPFTERRVPDDAAAVARLEGLGLQRVPVVTVGEAVWPYPGPDDFPHSLEQAIRRAGCWPD